MQGCGRNLGRYVFSFSSALYSERCTNLLLVLSLLIDMMILLLLFNLCLVSGGFALLQQTSSLAHLTGCGCTTTTTCPPAAGSISCPHGISKPGKHGPVGPKGQKGEPPESNERRIAEIHSEIVQLSDDLRVYRELSFSFPSTCSEYILYENENRKFEHVPLFPQKAVGNMTMILANCTRLDEIRGPKTYASINVPFNGVLGRTLILEATPVYLDGEDRFNVNFRGNGSDIFLHISVRLFHDQVARNDRKNGWNNEERDMNGDFPFHFGVTFTMKITVDDVGYHCMVDGEDIFTFNHRQTPLRDIQYVNANGRLNISFMSFN